MHWWKLISYLVFDGICGHLDDLRLKDSFIFLQFISYAYKSEAVLRAANTYILNL